MSDVILHRAPTYCEAGEEDLTVLICRRHRKQRAHNLAPGALQNNMWFCVSFRDTPLRQGAGAAAKSSASTEGHLSPEFEALDLTPLHLTPKSVSEPTKSTIDQEYY